MGNPDSVPEVKAALAKLNLNSPEAKSDLVAKTQELMIKNLKSKGVTINPDDLKIEITKVDDGSQVASSPVTENSWRNLWGYWPEKPSHQALAVTGAVAGAASLCLLYRQATKPRKTPFTALAEKLGANMSLSAGVAGDTLLAGGIAAHKLCSKKTSSESSESESSSEAPEKKELKAPRASVKKSKPRKVVK